MKTCQDSWCQDYDLDAGPRKYEVGAVAHIPPCSVGRMWM